MDEMWSFVGNKGNPRWLWHAIDHHTGVVLAYVFGRRKDAVFLQLKALLEPFGLTRFYTDHWGAYTRHLDVEVHSPGQTEHAEDRAEASDVTHADQTVSPQDNLLFEIDPDARHRHWLICESLCLWTACLKWPSPHLEHYPDAHAGPTSPYAANALLPMSVKV